MQSFKLLIPQLLQLLPPSLQVPLMATFMLLSLLLLLLFLIVDNHLQVSTDEEGSTESNQEDSKDLEEASDEDIVTNDAISNDAQQPMMKNGDSIHDNPHDDQNQSHHGEKDGDDEGDEGHHHHIPCSERKIEITDMAHSNGDSCLTVG